jgi:uncharacterized protein (DUF1697 family)
MPDYAAFLRGVNVGSHHRVSSADLCSLFEQLGFEDVSTFRTSGNVAFATGKEAVAKLTARIERGLEDSLGYEIAVFLRTASELQAIAGHRPFAPKQVERSKGKLQVTLLSEQPTAGARKEVLALATDDDQLAFDQRELYWLPSGGMSDSALDLKTIGKLLGPTTVRTKGTIEQLAAKYFATCH